MRNSYVAWVLQTKQIIWLWFDVFRSKWHFCCENGMLNVSVENQLTIQPVTISWLILFWVLQLYGYFRFVCFFVAFIAFSSGWTKSWCQKFGIRFNYFLIRVQINHFKLKTANYFRRQHAKRFHIFRCLTWKLSYQVFRSHFWRFQVAFLCSDFTAVCRQFANKLHGFRVIWSLLKIFCIILTEWPHKS